MGSLKEVILEVSKNEDRACVTALHRFTFFGTGIAFESRGRDCTSSPKIISEIARTIDYVHDEIALKQQTALRTRGGFLEDPHTLDKIDSSVETPKALKVLNYPTNKSLRKMHKTNRELKLSINSKIEPLDDLRTRLVQASDGRWDSSFKRSMESILRVK